MGRTYTTNTEANTKVYDLNHKSMKAFGHSGFLERAGKTLSEVDDFVTLQEAMVKVKDAQRFEEIAQEQAYSRREEYHQLHDDFES